MERGFEGERFGVMGARMFLTAEERKKSSDLGVGCLGVVDLTGVLKGASLVGGGVANRVED